MPADPHDDLLVELGPLQLGPFEIVGVPAAGALLALGFLLSLSLALRLGRLRDVPPRLVLELHAVLVPTALLGSRLPALGRQWRAVVDHPRALADVALAPPEVAAGLAAVALVAGLLAVLSGRPWRDLADVLAPGLVLGLTAWEARRLLAAPPDALPLIGQVLIAGLGAVVAARVVAGSGRAGEGVIVATEGIALSAFVPGAPWTPVAFQARMAVGVALALLLLGHVLLRARTTGWREASVRG